MSSFELTYKRFGTNAILIEWPAIIAPDILNDIQIFILNIQKNSIEQILEISSVYNSILILYKPKKIKFTDLVDALKSIYTEINVSTNKTQITWEIPVCYDEEFGLDLADMASIKNKSIDWLIAAHTTPVYTVYGVGFLPGFLYLGGLSEALHFSRKKTPRISVPKGTVAIGGNQTGIYPKASPGGWQLLGKTPISLFDASKKEPCQIQAGDAIKFKSISKARLVALEKAVALGTYELKTLSND